MIAIYPPWYLDPDSEDTLCQCGHRSISHVEEEGTYPCTEDSYWAVGAGGGMELREDGCPCTNYTQEN